MPQAINSINSALSQNYENFNILIIDNGKCKDLNDYLIKLNNKRIKIHSYSEVLPIEKNWERIEKIKKKKYITVLGHDDFLEVNFLDQINRLINKNNEKIIYGSLGILVDYNYTKIRSINLNPGIISFESYVSDRFKFKSDISGTGWIFSSKLFDDLGGFPKYKKLFFSDDALILKLLKKGNGIISNKNLYKVMIHEKSQSYTKPDMALDLLFAIEKFNELLTQKNFLDKKYYKLKNSFIKKYLIKIGILIIFQEKFKNASYFNKYKITFNKILIKNLMDQYVLFFLKIIRVVVYLMPTFILKNILSFYKFLKK